MSIDRELSRIVAQYEDDGYQVTLRPGPSDLPGFARDFHVELIGKRGAGGVLVAVKRNREEFASDHNMDRYAEVTANQPEWRFDFVILEPEDELRREIRGAQEPSDDQLKAASQTVKALYPGGFVNQALIAAWALFEAAMRRRLRADGETVGWGSAPRQMMNELFSSGALSSEEFTQIEKIYRLRNEIVHGFSTHVEVDESAVEFLLGVSTRLLDESKQLSPA